MMMHDSKQISSQPEIKRFLTTLYASKEEFLEEYSKYHGKEVYLQLLSELEMTILIGDVDSFKNLCNIICWISDFEDKSTLRTYYDDAPSSFTSTNLVILACEYCEVEILDYILDNTGVLYHLSVSIGRDAVAPDDEDETYHNAFYYAVRSCNKYLLSTLIRKWPDNYFAVHERELEKHLSETYEELQLENVPLSDEIEIFVEKELIELRFFSKNVSNAKPAVRNIVGRIELVLENIASLILHKESVDDEFIYRAKFVARNIHVLKCQLRSTYDRLPWEEIEFCLVSFISSHIKQQEINFFYKSTLNKDRIINHLEKFAEVLKGEKDNIASTDIDKLAVLPKSKREDVVAHIIDNYPQLKELYSDHRQIMDVYSLEKISSYVTLALSVDVKEREGQMVIMRTLQVIGEYLKNTLDSPNLSNIKKEIILLSVPRNTRNIIINFHNSLSSACSLALRIQIEENVNIDFFCGVQKDIGKIKSKLLRNLGINTLGVIRTLLKKIVDSEDVNEIKNVIDILAIADLHKLSQQIIEMMDMEKTEKLVDKLKDLIIEQTVIEETLFTKMYLIINSNKTVIKGINYSSGLATIKCMNSYNKYVNEIENHQFYEIKRAAKEALQNFTNIVIPDMYQGIPKLLTNIIECIETRTRGNNIADLIKEIISEILSVTEYEAECLKSIEKLIQKLYKENSFLFDHKEESTCIVSEEKYNDHLQLKLFELKNILKCASSKQFISCKNNKKFNAVVDMLVLNILSNLDHSKDCLVNSIIYLDDNCPLLIGKCLYNHLEHDNALIHILLSDPTRTVILNAEKLIESNFPTSNMKIGTFVEDDLLSLKYKHEKGLVAITNKKDMFVALERGDLDSLKRCIEKGGDINARNIHQWTTLHFAAKGSSLEVVKFIMDQNLSANIKNISNQSPLHIAAIYGRKSIVEFFVEVVGLFVDMIDNHGKTPLHCAAEDNHKDVVQVLLRDNACTKIHDLHGLAPLHYAVQNNSKDVLHILLQADSRVKTVDNFTSLHIAAEYGYLETVNFLLQNKANVNAKNVAGATPLHSAIINGNQRIVIALTIRGADVNARLITGCTPLHCAVESNQTQIIKYLLKQRVNVNCADNEGNTPLHSAAKLGHEEIIKALLDNKASTVAVNFENKTPLHIAALNGNLAIVAALLKHHVDVNAKDLVNYTPLHCAVVRGHYKVVDLLIKSKADVNAVNEIGIRPLSLAASTGHKEIVSLLVKNKAKINVSIFNGNTPLHAACIKVHTEVVDLLVKSKAKINAKNTRDETPLLLAARHNRMDAAVILMQHGADVDAKTFKGFTPLHEAIIERHIDFVRFLLKNGAAVNAQNYQGVLPLKLAIEAGHKEIVEALIAHGATINTKSNDLSPLFCAVKQNFKNIVEILLANGGNVNVVGCKMYPHTPLLWAVEHNFTEIVEILIENGAHTDISCLKRAVILNHENIVEILLKKVNVPTQNTVDHSLLHFAAKAGNKRIVEAFIKNGVDVDAKTEENITPIHLAAEGGFAEIVAILHQNGAQIVGNSKTSPLHAASSRGHNEVVQVLLKCGADISRKDYKKKSALELAISHGQLQVVRMLLEHYKVNINTKCSNGWPLLHIAAQAGYVEILEYLVAKGADISATTIDTGAKLVHIAAREGFKNIVDFCLSRGQSINSLDKFNMTPLFYAVVKGQLNFVEYLLEKGADVNIKDAVFLSTPIHFAAFHNHKGIVEVLLKKGAVYNTVNKVLMKPINMAKNMDVINLLASTESLFEAIKQDKLSEVRNFIKTGLGNNARDVDGGTPLHYAAWKGHEEIVHLLLQFGSDPNAVGKNGLTPLHFATKFSHLKVVKALLSHGAIYNSTSASGKTPSDFSFNVDVSRFLRFVHRTFNCIKNGDPKINDELISITDVETMKAVMNARNNENKTLVIVAILNNYPKIGQLKNMFQQDVSIRFDEVVVLLTQEKYEEAVKLLRIILNNRKAIFGFDNPATIDIREMIANVRYQQQQYPVALSIFEKIYQKRKEMLGVNNIDALITRRSISLILHKQGNDQEALNILNEVYENLKRTLGIDHFEALWTQSYIASVLATQEKYEEALRTNYEVFDKCKEIFDVSHPLTSSTQNNIAKILDNQGMLIEAKMMYHEVYCKTMNTLGPTHSDTAKSLYNVASVFMKLNKLDKALKFFKEVYDTQKSVLGLNHLDTLATLNNIGNLLFSQGKYITALKCYNECFDQGKSILGPDHPDILTTSRNMEHINLSLKFAGSKASEILTFFQKKLHNAANKGDIQTIQSLIKNGVDVNDKDVDGRTALHFAIYNGHLSVVCILLKNGADVTQITNKGNTPLHVAVSKGYEEIVDVLLQHVDPEKLNDFVNAKTLVGGVTALHLAAKNNLFGVVISLLKCGAIYNTENKEGKIPLVLTDHKDISDLLKLTEQLFQDAKNGNVEIIDKLRSLTFDFLMATTKTQNNQRNTLVQLAEVNGHEEIAKSLLCLDMFKNSDHDTAAYSE